MHNQHRMHTGQLGEASVQSVLIMHKIELAGIVTSDASLWGNLRKRQFLDCIQRLLRYGMEVHGRLRRPTHEADATAAISAKWITECKSIAPAYSCQA